MSAAMTLTRLEEHRQVTLPADVCDRLGLKAGDLVTVTETPEGVLIRSQAAAVAWALNQIGEVLREEGVTLDELIESGREERDDLIRELYGIDPAEYVNGND